MATIKAITSEYSDHVYVIERQDWCISFYDIKTRRHYTRKVWFSVRNSDMYVQYKNKFYSIVTEHDGKYDPWCCMEYTEVSNQQLREMTRKAYQHRYCSIHHEDYSFEELTQIYACAVVDWRFDHDTCATMGEMCDKLLGYMDHGTETTEQEDEDTCETMLEDASQYDDDAILFSSSHDSEATEDGTDWTYDDGGRSEHFKAEGVGDCVCRAVAIATGKDYMEVYRDINELAKSERTGKRKRGISSARNGVYKNTVRKLMESYGWRWHPTMLVGQGCKVHLRGDELPSGRLVVSLSKHVTCVIDGIVHDTYDPSRGGTRCVYGYWSR